MENSSYRGKYNVILNTWLILWPTVMWPTIITFNAKCHLLVIVNETESELKSLKIITQNKPLKLLNLTRLISVNGYKSACYQDKTISVSMSTCDFQVQSGPVVKWLAQLPPNSRKFLFQTCPRPFSVESACSTCAYKHFLKVLHSVKSWFQMNSELLPCGRLVTYSGCTPASHLVTAGCAPGFVQHWIRLLIKEMNGP